jgi:hypothetical protein
MVKAKVWLWIHTALDCIYDLEKQKSQWLFMALSESVKGLLKWQTLQEPQLVELDRCLCKWFIAMHSEGNPLTRPMIIEKA